MEDKILTYIKEYMVNCGITPTIREIGVGVGLHSTSTVHKYMKRLADKGLIERLDKGMSRYRVKGMKYTQE